MNANAATGTAGRVVAAVALVAAVGVFALTLFLALWPLSPGPDVYLEGHEVPTFTALAVAHLVIVGYAIWGLSLFARGRPGPFWSTALAYVLGGALTPFVFLLAIRWFSGG